MVTAPDVLSDGFRQEQSWLGRQPGMSPWERGCQSLLAEIDGWLAADSPSFCEQPVTRDSPRYGPFVRRLWGCWSYHWREAAARSPVAGRSVAEALRDGRSPVHGGKLGGDPLRDMVWVEALLHGDNRAIRLFYEHFRLPVERWAREVNVALASDLEWWQDMSTKLIGDPSRAGTLASFSGKSALEPWLKTTVKRQLIRESVRRGKESDRRDELQQQLNETSHATPSRDVMSAECLELLSGALRSVLLDAARNERLAMRLLLLDGLSLVDVAKVLQIHKGNVTRATQRFMQRVQETLGIGPTDAAGVESNPLYERYAPCLEHVFDSGDRTALRGLLARVVADLGEMEPAP